MCHTTRPLYHALEYIKSKGPVMMEEDPAVPGAGYKRGFHNAIYYVCCQTREGKELIEKNVIRKMDWTSFTIEYDTFGCNMDGKGDSAYLHALATNTT